ncbi:hypothetical protein NFI96_002780 [Prochilodus magdalenae]|nr:hypothetical protein NFI96_002780 [Prochilodus magdalenae]
MQNVVFHQFTPIYPTCSSTVELKFNLDQYVNKRYPGLVKIVRNSKREGLIRARIHGWNAATAPVVGFFDAHVEFNTAWKGNADEPPKVLLMWGLALPALRG